MLTRPGVSRPRPEIKAKVELNSYGAMAVPMTLVYQCTVSVIIPWLCLEEYWPLWPWPWLWTSQGLTTLLTYLLIWLCSRVAAECCSKSIREMNEAYNRQRFIRWRRWVTNVRRLAFNFHAGGPPSPPCLFIWLTWESCVCHVPVGLIIAARVRLDVRSMASRFTGYSGWAALKSH